MHYEWVSTSRVLSVYVLSTCVSSRPLLRIQARTADLSAALAEAEDSCKAHAAEKTARMKRVEELEQTLKVLELDLQALAQQNAMKVGMASWYFISTICCFFFMEWAQSVHEKDRRSRKRDMQAA